ncbi:aldehyde dehydrogenase (NADP(+)) [Actinokineospora soli]
MFARVVRGGAHVDAILSPGPPDVRRMLQPIGPVAVFSASNFPFAFSVAGGDTASALAAGCGVVVKAHEAHPRTSEAVAALLASVGAPVALVHGFEAGRALVEHPLIRAVGFTGSLRGGRALFDLAAGRADPIPFYGELGSVNPVVVLPGAAAERPAEIADGYAASLTLGTGQFCTNPGLLFVPEDSALLDEISRAVATTSGGPMLSAKIRDAYLGADSPLPVLAEGTAAAGAWSVRPRVSTVAAKDFTPDLAEETFGPAGLVVTYRDTDELVAVLSAVPGSLTGSVHAAPANPAAAVADVLRTRVGRLVFNGWPTGVAVNWAMHHGGPWPATTAPAHTSVGATAIRRWLVPVAYQDWPDALLPPELQDANPLDIPRLTEPPL